MRLRMRIERNDLPPTRTLWPVNDPNITVSQLLRAINHVFPLEADTWGLEDYAISVAGYECLHYHVVGEVCKDDDEVRIHPYSYTDVRGRTLAGRDQIAPDGRHLVDGVPFGRPLLRAPTRPEVSIPPRKRRRLMAEQDVGEAHEEQDREPLRLMEDGEPDEDEDDESEDQDFMTDEEDGSAAESGSDDSSEASLSEAQDGATSDSSSSTSSSTSSSEDSPDSDSEASEEWRGIPPTPKKRACPPSTTPDIGNKRKRGENDEAVKESQEPKAAKKIVGVPFEGKNETKSRNARRRDANKLRHLKEIKVLPATARMLDLKNWESSSANTTPQPRTDADGTHIPVSLATPAGTKPVPGETSGVTCGAASSSSESDSQSSDSDSKDSSDDSVDHEPAKNSSQRQKNKKQATGASKESDEFEARRQALLSGIADGGVEVTPIAKHSMGPTAGDDDDEGPEELGSKEQPPATLSTSTADARKPTITQSTTMVPPSVARRSKLDLAGSQRLLYGSLGVRVPKTQDQKDLLQSKLAARAGRNAAKEATQATETTQQKEPPQNAGADQEDNGNESSWQDKIHLTAVECCQDDVTYSTPPFPFYQRWDPHQRKKKTNKRTKKTYMEGPRKSHKQNGDFFETYDKYNTNGGGDGLDYDDAEEEEDDDDEYWEEGALLEDEGEHEDGFGEAEEEDTSGFPPMPPSSDSLPALAESDAVTGDVIAFSELACDESTKWQPAMTTRLARIQNVAGEAEARIFELDVLLQRKKKRFDQEGNRVYQKFEMPDMEDEEGDEEGDGGAATEMRVVGWAGLGPGVKLVEKGGGVQGGGLGDA